MKKRVADSGQRTGSECEDPPGTTESGARRFWTRARHPELGTKFCSVFAVRYPLSAIRFPS